MSARSSLEPLPLEPLFLPELRQATRRAHSELDARVGFRDEMTRERYVAFLRGSLGVVEWLEPALAAWLGPSSELEDRTECLRADLARLDVHLSTPSTPAVNESRGITSYAAAIGASYVVEGSSLGGAVLARIVGSALSLDEDGLRYLRFYGARTGDRWRAFVHDLEAWAATASAAERHEACAAASCTFEAYAASFERAGAFAVTFAVAITGAITGAQ